MNWFFFSNTIYLFSEMNKLTRIKTRFYRIRYGFYGLINILCDFMFLRIGFWLWDRRRNINCFFLSKCYSIYFLCIIARIPISLKKESSYSINSLLNLRLTVNTLTIGWLQNLTLTVWNAIMQMVTLKLLEDFKDHLIMWAVPVFLRSSYTMN